LKLLKLQNIKAKTTCIILLFKWLFKPTNINFVAFAQLHVFKYLRSLNGKGVNFVIYVIKVKEINPFEQYDLFDFNPKS